VHQNVFDGLALPGAAW